MIKIILLTTTLLCLSPYRIVDIGNEKDANGYYHAGDYDYIECTSLDKEHETLIHAKASFLKGSNASRIYIGIIKFDNEEGASDTLFSLTSTKYENEFNISYVTKYYSDATLSFSIISTSTRKTIVQREIKLSYASHEKIYGDKINGHFESANASAFYEHKAGYYYDKDIIDTKGMDGYYELDSTQRIDFSKIRIKYSSLYSSFTTFPYKEIGFFISNYNNVFSNLGKLSIDNAITNIDLKLNYDNEANEYYLGFKDKQYVNPKTFEMSSIQFDGYVETTCLYLPKGYDGFYSSWNCGFVIYQIGMNKIMLACSLALINGKRIMGNCVNSDYCIISESASPDFEVGTVVEHNND